MKVSNVLNTLTLKQIFWKKKAFFKKLEYHFLVETTEIKTHHFHSKLLCQKPMLRDIEWQLQNGPITKSGVLPVSTLFFRTFFPVLEPLNDKWTKKMLNIKHFWGHFSIKHCPPKNSLTRYSLMGLKNYAISLLLKKKSVKFANMFGKYSCWNLAFAFCP